MDYDPDECSPLHCLPIDDFREHTLDDKGKCWCRPIYDEDCNIYIHNSMDGREDYEEGRRKPH